MSANKDRDYVLGTHDEEIARLGLQHRVWRSTVFECWRAAGIRSGSRVLDVGAGPGYATVDLAEIVGARGEVLAVERSARFLAQARSACAVRGLDHVRFQEADLMEHALDAQGFDFAWTRWVASFVRSPALLMQRIASALRPGGKAIFHEYSNYGTWQLAPRRAPLEAFVHEVMRSWREAGGEPDVAPSLPTLLRDAGLTVTHTAPRIFVTSPADDVWLWPVSFIEINLERLLELGRVNIEWVQAVRDTLRDAQADPLSRMTTPLVMEIVAIKEG